MDKISILAIDQSIRDSGLCLFHKKGGKYNLILAHTDSFFPPDKKDSNLQYMLLYILNIIYKYDVRHIVFEDYAFSKFGQSSSITQLIELVGAIKSFLLEKGITYEFVSTSHAAKILTGVGKFKTSKIKKEAVFDFSIKKISTCMENKIFSCNDFDSFVNLKNYNISDAFALMYTFLIEKNMLTI